MSFREAACPLIDGVGFCAARGLADGELAVTDRYIRDVLLNFILAGRDTTAQTLMWALYYLAQPENEVRVSVCVCMRAVGGVGVVAVAVAVVVLYPSPTRRL